MSTVTRVTFLIMIVLITVVSMHAAIKSLGITKSDWELLRRSALSFLHPERAPYPVYAPWLYVTLFPIAALPMRWGWATVITLSLLVLALYTRSWWRALLLVSAYPVAYGVILGQIDTLLVVALMLPLEWATLVVSCKPITLLPWLAMRYVREQRWVAVLPMAGVFAMSLVLWGLWPARLQFDAVGMGTKAASSWPRLLVVGVILLLGRDDEMAWLLAGLFLTPYLASYHMTPMLAYVYKHEKRAWPLVVYTAASWLAWGLGEWM